MSCTKCVIRLSASADLFFRIFVAYCNFIALTLFVRHQEQHPAWLLKRCVGLHFCIVYYSVLYACIGL